MEGIVQKEQHLTIDYKIGFFVDKTGKSTVYDRVERKWQHQNIFEHKCYLHCKTPRVKTLENIVEQVLVPWAREGSGFALMFEAFITLLMRPIVVTPELTTGSFKEKKRFPCRGAEIPQYVLFVLGLSREDLLILYNTRT